MKVTIWGVRFDYIKNIILFIYYEQSSQVVWTVIFTAAYFK